MNGLSKITLYTINIIFLFHTNLLTAQINMSEKLPVDENVKIGKLENGLVYYIRKNSKPENRVEMRLAVNAGSINETDGQKGLAHFTEHMCFNGTKKFPKNELINFLQKSGIKFGADINAYTSFDETVYMLQLPTDKPDMVETGIQVLEEWAHNVTLDGKEIDKERGIIEEEWRLGLGADDRMRKKYLPVIFKNSRYADRLPIGDINIIRTFHHDTIRKFYNDWYRPDLQAVIVVGDINVDSIEKKIIAHFSKIPVRPNAPQRQYYQIPDNEQPLISIVSDKEATSANVMLIYKQQKTFVNTYEEYRMRIMQRLFTGMLNMRLRELAEQPNAPFNSASANYGNFMSRARDAFMLNASAKETNIVMALSALLTEVQRLKKYGFLQSELERQKEDLLNQYEKSAKEADKTESAVWAREYVLNYLINEPIPGRKNEFKIVKNLLPEITLAEINELAQKWFTDKNIVVVITAPEKDNVKIPTEEQVLDELKKASSIEVMPYVDNFSDKPLIEKELQGGKVIKQQHNEILDFTELTLRNGVRVIVKSTDFKNDEILFSATSFGGASLYPDDDVVSCMFAANVISQSGLGNFNKIELEKKLKGKTISLNPNISDISEGFTGRTSPKDLETFLQMLYLYFDAPRKDTTAFKTFINKTTSQLKFVAANPVFAFNDTLIKTTASNNPRVFTIPTEKQLNQLQLDKLYKIYKERFGDVSDFTFFFVGTVNVDTLIPLLEKYLGSLPAKNQKEKFRDVSPVFPPKGAEVKIYKGKDPKSMVGLVFKNDFDWDTKQIVRMQMLKEIINIKLVETIREEMSGVYSPRIQISMERWPKPVYTLTIMYGCSPNNTEKLTKATLNIIKTICKKGPTDTDLSKVKEQLVRERETQIKTNRFWLNYLENIYVNNDVPYPTDTYFQIVKSTTINDIKTIASKYIFTNKYVRIVLFPEKNK